MLLKGRTEKMYVYLRKCACSTVMKKSKFLSLDVFRRKRSVIFLNNGGW